MDILSDIEIYCNRTSRAYNKLADAHFDWRNYGWGDTFMLGDVGGYCIDAPEQMPAGSMYSWGRQGMTRTGMRLICREQLEYTSEQLAAREALAKRLIAEILAEEAK